MDTYLHKKKKAAPLAVFRIVFGLLMLISLIRFAANGWIDSFYIQPGFFFSYHGFEWVRPVGEYTYLVFLTGAVSSILVAVGYKYRWAIIVFFLSFTWIELMDKTTYLNHYYFISVLSFLMIFLPAHTYFSVDACQNKKQSAQYIPAWCIDSVKLLLLLVYLYAGIAKLNPDWLFEALPLKIWLAAKQDLPLLGDILALKWMPYVFSWAGAAFDLSIGFLLWMKTTRPYAFVLVVIFHLLTGVLFPIGMFPYIMICSTLIFFYAAFHNRLLTMISKVIGIQKAGFENGKTYRFSPKSLRNSVRGIVVIFFVIQFLFPLRYLMYPGNVSWTEEGYRFSWRVMLMEKFGSALFRVVDSENGQQILIDNSRFLSPMQEKQMSTQPDFILEYAHFLKAYYERNGIKNPKVYVENYVTLNGRRSQLMVDPTVNLAEKEPSLMPKKWILPLKQE